MRRFRGYGRCGHPDTDREVRRRGWCADCVWRVSTVHGLAGVPTAPRATSCVSVRAGGAGAGGSRNETGVSTGSYPSVPSTGSQSINSESFSGVGMEILSGEGT